MPHRESFRQPLSNIELLCTVSGVEFTGIEKLVPIIEIAEQESLILAQAFNKPLLTVEPLDDSIKRVREHGSRVLSSLQYIGKILLEGSKSDDDKIFLASNILLSHFYIYRSEFYKVHKAAANRLINKPEVVRLSIAKGLDVELGSIPERIKIVGCDMILGWINAYEEFDYIKKY